VEWAASQNQATFTGTIDRWNNAEHKVLMIKWEGWGRCRQAELSTLDKDTDGETVELELLPYDDGRPAPTLVEKEDEDEQAAGTDDDGSFDDEHDPDMLPEDDEVTVTCAQPMKPLGIKELEWRKELPTGINVDARDKDRFKPTLNAEFDLNDIESIFHYLLPDGWIELQLKHTNPKLSALDKTRIRQMQSSPRARSSASGATPSRCPSTRASLSSGDVVRPAERRLDPAAAVHGAPRHDIRGVQEDPLRPLLRPERRGVAAPTTGRSSATWSLCTTSRARRW
jgi:hypothetical protein